MCASQESFSKFLLVLQTLLILLLLTLFLYFHGEVKLSRKMFLSATHNRCPQHSHAYNRNKRDITSGGFLSEERGEGNGSRGALSPHEIVGTLWSVDLSPLPPGLSYRALFLVGLVEGARNYDRPPPTCTLPTITVEHTCQCHCEYPSMELEHENGTDANLTSTIFYPDANHTVSNETDVNSTLASIHTELLCTLDIVGKPVLHGRSPWGSVGTWLRDPLPRPGTEEKRWIIGGSRSVVLNEYTSEGEMTEGEVKPKKHFLNQTGTGTGSLLLNNSFYYHQTGTHFIARLDLYTGLETLVALPNLAHEDCPEGVEVCGVEERDPYLYDIPHNYVDLSFEEDKIWAVYRKKGKSYVTVSLLDCEEWPTVLRTWDLRAANATSLGNSFILCGGVFYGVESGTKKWTMIHYEYKLFQDEQTRVRISWMNPFSSMTSLSYNSYDDRLYFYDRGRLLSVPFRVKLKKEATEPPEPSPL